MSKVVMLLGLFICSQVVSANIVPIYNIGSDIVWDANGYREVTVCIKNETPCRVLKVRKSLMSSSLSDMSNHVKGMDPLKICDQGSNWSKFKKKHLKKFGDVSPLRIYRIIKNRKKQRNFAACYNFFREQHIREEYPDMKKKDIIDQFIDPFGYVSFMYPIFHFFGIME